MKQWTEIDGHNIRLDAVTGIGKVETFSTGALSYQWVYGFKVYVGGTEIKIAPPQPRGYGTAGGPTRESYRASIERLRDGLLREIEEYVD